MQILTMVQKRLRINEECSTNLDQISIVANNRLDGGNS